MFNSIFEIDEGGLNSFFVSRREYFKSEIARRDCVPQEYKFVVTARDGAPDYRLATATVTVKVIDVEDEVPVFHQSSYEARVKENIPDYTVLQVTVGTSTHFPLNNEKKLDLTKRKLTVVHKFILPRFYPDIFPKIR